MRTGGLGQSDGEWQDDLVPDARSACGEERPPGESGRQPISAVAARLSRLDRRLGAWERAELTQLAGGTTLQNIAGGIVVALDPDTQLAAARGASAAEEPPSRRSLPPLAAPSIRPSQRWRPIPNLGSGSSTCARCTNRSSTTPPPTRSSRPATPPTPPTVLATPSSPGNNSGVGNTWYAPGYSVGDAQGGGS